MVGRSLRLNSLPPSIVHTIMRVQASLDLVSAPHRIPPTPPLPHWPTPGGWAWLLEGSVDHLHRNREMEVLLAA